MQQNSSTVKIGEKQGEIGRPHGKDGCRHTSKESGRERLKNIKMQEKGNEQLRSKECVRWDMRRSGEDERLRGGNERWRGGSR